MPIERHENSAVLFADISGSTKLYVAVGDDRAREIVARTLDLWSALTVDGGGQVIQLRGDGMVNPTKGKQLTNIRSAGADENIILTPPIKFSLEQALEFIDDDELVEVTPVSIRLRKKLLKEAERRRESRAQA